MAEEKEYQFTPPDFDEEAFIHKEMVSFRTTAILFVWGIAAAAASWAIFLWNPELGWPLGLLVCAVSGLALKLLFPRLGADVSHFKRREWTGTAFLFFFTWLSFFILAINPPVTDVASPEVFVDAPPVAQAGSNLTFEALATDNAHLQGHSLKVERAGLGEVAAKVETLPNGRLRATVANAAPGTYNAIATASDGRNADTVRTNTTQVGDVVHLKLPATGTLDDTNFVAVTLDGQRACTAEDVRDAKTCIRVVALRPTDGSPDILLEPKDGSTWKAEASFKGWKAGNNTFTVYADFQERFVGAQRIPGGRLTLDAPATLRVPAPTGTHEVSVTPQPAHRQIAIPGPEVALVAVVVLAVAFLARRRAQA